MSGESQHAAGIVAPFGEVLSCLTSGTDYKQRPPTGPPSDLPALSDAELTELQQSTSLVGGTQQFNYISLALAEEDARPVPVPFPESSDLSDLNVCGIDGSNQRVARGSFYFVIARASVVDFRYSSSNAKPYFYTQSRDASGVIWVDGNIFDDKVRLFTSVINETDNEKFNVLNAVKADSSLPFLLRYDSSTVDKSPSNHALGWAVKLQQALEMSCLARIRTDIRTVCIKDGPLFSTSLSALENLNGLQVIHGWKDQILVASSKRVQDSRLLTELLLTKNELREYWFPEQNLTDSTIRQISSDALLLPRILHPGHRTPLVEAVPRARVEVSKSDPRLTPLACYYLSRQRPHTYIRLEVAKSQWQSHPDDVLKAISIVAWQHELGRTAPLVQLVADERCQLQNEKRILEYQTSFAVNRNRLDLPEAYE